MRKTVIVPEATKPAGPYSHAVVANGFVFVAGQGPLIPETGVIPDNFKEQVRQTRGHLCRNAVYTTAQRLQAKTHWRYPIHVLFLFVHIL